MEAASTGIWPTPTIDLHHLGAANFCDGLLHRGLRACRRFLIKPGSSAYFPGGDCDRRPDVVDEQSGRVILPRAGPQNLGPITYLNRLNVLNRLNGHWKQRQNLRGLIHKFLRGEKTP